MIRESLDEPLPLDGSPRRSVLIVDDDDCTAEVLSLRLGQQGFDTLTATSGERALAMA